MANTKISALSAASALAGTEALPVVQSGSTKKTTAQDIADLAAAAIAAAGVVTQTAVSSATTLTASNYGHSIFASGSSAYTITLPTAVGHTGEVIHLNMSPALTALVTIAGTSAQTIGGAASKVLWAGESMKVKANGTNWDVLTAYSRPMVCAVRLNANQTAIANNAARVVTNNATDLDNSGLMADLANNAIIVRRTGLYRVSFILSYLEGVVVPRLLGQIYKNGDTATVLLAAETEVRTTSSDPAISATRILSLTAADSLKQYVFSTAAGNVSLYSTASSTFTGFGLEEVL